MNQRVTRVYLSVLAVVVTAGPVVAQQTSTDELKREIQALQKDLQEIKGMLARPSPLGIGAVIEYGSGPANGERTARLTLVEFSDHQ